MRAKRVDAPQKEIIAALRQAGALVHPTHTVHDGFPDLVVGNPSSWRIGLLEIKDGSKAPSRRVKTPDQIRFFDQWAGFPLAMVGDVEAALRFYSMLGK